MKTIILGGNKENLGGALADGLGDCLALSRRTQPSIDVLHPHSIEGLIQREKPETLIFTAMAYPDQSPKPLGDIENWEEMNRFFDTKVKGCFITINLAVRHRVRRFVVIAGSHLSGDSRLCHFATVNNALWGLVQFVTKHTSLDAYYLEMGVVLPSKIGARYLESLAPEEREGVCSGAIAPQDLVRCVKNILADHYPRGTRVVLNKGNS